MVKIFFGIKFIRGAIHNIMIDRKKIGANGEKIACEYLLKHNFIVMQLEVKARKNFFCGRPSEFVDLKKQAKIKKTALDFIVKKNIVDKNFRFDVIEVLNKKVWHIINAFDF